MSEVKRLYLPSTPFNLLLSFLDAQSRGGENVLVYIDQKTITPYAETLLALQESPFKEVSVLYDVSKGRAKLEERHQNFQALDRLLEGYGFDEVVTGSDRRIEFQYVMHRLRKATNDVVGTYLDDGLYSYLTWKRPVYEHFLNSLVKKIVYGSWWQEPRTPGTSPYISRSILMNADFALESLKNREVCPIDFSLLSCKPLQHWAQSLLDAFDCNAKTAGEVDVFFILPHPNDVQKMPGYVERLKSSIRDKVGSGFKVSVKYHPRFTEKDAFNLKELGTMLLPSNLAFEFLLPVLKSNAEIIGDFTTVMLTSKMLRPDLSVIANINLDDPYQLQLLELLRKFEIKVIEKRSL
ncbi:hypothetical protein [Hydrogenovibrio marinus]|uniref:Uncharacterized protein n=1 Tax=Hydrogenovibrio marinus TaxID=28885 RepID=A0A067A2Q1_HYDMR|nr:hypothetical protein [Hydrogenovibrio marinus]KDN96630.1 hypothetical protein EI16_10280 [Hydrogenovibrio marinus]BBN60159.1 hypothetical protein HVMH_1753 [Hydrogenovibrio marinus]